MSSSSPKPFFHLYVWPQRLLMLAPSYASGRHRHHAAQIACGLEGPVVFESPQTGLHRADALLIPPDVPHSHTAFGPSAVVYLEPESAEWARLCDQQSSGIVSMPFDARLRSFSRSAAGGDVAAAQALIDGLIGRGPNHNASEDVLITQACALIRERLDGRITLASLAAAVHRSPSRLAHRFREATGVPLRRYVLWRRLRAAAEAAMRGASLTEAAYVAGFADSAHLSRTFRATFGIAPSFMFDPGRLSVTFCEAAASA